MPTIPPTLTDTASQGAPVGVNGDGPQSSTTLLPSTKESGQEVGPTLQSATAVSSVDDSSSNTQPEAANEEKLHDQTFASESGSLGPSDADTSRVDDSFIFQQVQAGNSGASLPLSSTTAPSAIPGLDSLFQEGVDYRKQQQQQQPSQNPPAVANIGDNEDDDDSADSDAEANSSKPDTFLTSSAGEQKNKGQHSESFDPRRPLSLPLPPTTEEEEMEEDDEGEEGRSSSKTKTEGPAGAENSSPVVPVVSTESTAAVDPSLTDMVSNAVK